MITKNFKNLLKLFLERSSLDKGLLPAKAVNGTTYYLSPLIPSSAFPNSVTENFTLTAASSGIVVGSSATAATENDYCIISPITSGLWSATLRTMGLDSFDNPYIKYEICLKNTSQSNITINEIGYQQSLYASTQLNSSGNANYVFLLDRTVLDAPIVMEPNDFITLSYTLSTQN